MAYGIPCKFCGYQEADHSEGSDDGLLPGRERTLNMCKDSVEGYVPEDAELSEGLKKREEDEEILRVKREFGEFMA